MRSDKRKPKKQTTNAEPVAEVNALEHTTRRDKGRRDEGRVAEANDQVVVPLIEESLLVDKQWVEAGQVLIKKEVESRTESVPIDLEYDEVQIDRVPVNRVLAYDEEIGPRQEGDVLIIPVVEEELVVTKRRVIREEVRVSKRRATRQEEASDVVRSERISVENRGNIEFLGDENPG